MGVIRYALTLEVVEGESCDMHRLGETFRWPEDAGKLCPWLADSMGGMLKVLQFGGSLPWTYRGTAYEKSVDPNGDTTEFVRCPDPTPNGIVVKITRRPAPPKDVGWA